MKTLIAIAVMVAGFSISAAETTYNFRCEAPNLHYVNKLEMTGSVTVWEEAETAEDKVRTIAKSFSMNLQKAGYNQTQETVESGKMIGTMKYYNDPSWTKKPFYRLSLLPKKNAVTNVKYMNLLFDYPGKLTSFVRTKDGRQYKGQCRLTSVKACLFGDTLQDTDEIKRLKVTPIAEIFVNAPVGAIGERVLVQKNKIVDTKTGREFHVFYTFEDEYDGGNTWGWFEDAKGKVVAEIGDSDIYDCKAYK